MLIFIILSVLFSVYFVLISLPALMAQYGMPFPDLLEGVSPTASLVILMIGTLYLAYDGFGETHLVKKLSLGVSIFLTLYYFYLALHMFGIIAFSLGSGLMLAINLAYFAAATLLILGIFLHHTG
ncbi:MAG: hypothetical protein QS98_C0003G0100 [archaeon GW2011_AR3]|nr:MAG: hypothetical protein QS98_C0003G0100 [archaeon GW2011_AR3]MBS3110142.1 hypothetical protein [Candidatus Woesearchaeota archaeon]